MKSKELHDILKKHFKKYPQSMPQDIVKLVYQSEYGCGHMLTDKAAALQSIQNEAKKIPAGFGGIAVEEIGADMYRVYLPCATEELALRAICDMFYLTANQKNGNDTAFKNMLAVLGKGNFYNKARFKKNEMKSYLDTYIKAECPVCHHSEIYNACYTPAYRVVSGKFLRLYDVFCHIEAMLLNNEHTVIAIEGPSAAGKTELSSILSVCFNADVVHMDDFFLPQSKRTLQRLKTPGGNVDYERFCEQVKNKITLGQKFEYDVFSCKTMSYAYKRNIDASKPLTIVEGVYSMHPSIVKMYNFKIFINILPRTQQKRILKRNGAKQAKQFTNKWIPMENEYFETFKTKKACDYILDEFF